MSSRAVEVTRKLENTWAHWWTCSLWTGLLTAGAISLATFTLFALVDARLHLSQAALGALLAVWSLLTIVTLGLLFHRLLRFQRSLEATARRVELELPELGSHLINLVQLAEATDPYRVAAREQAAAAVAEVPFDRAADRLPRWRRLTLCMQTPRDLLEAAAALAATLLLAALAGSFVNGWTTATRRLTTPWSFVPIRGSLVITKVTPGDAEVLLGTSVDVAVEVDNQDRLPRAATLVIEPEKGQSTRVAMHGDAANRAFVAALPQVVGPLRYRVEVGDSQSDRFKVSVYQKPTIASVAVAYEFPTYLARPKLELKQSVPDLEGPPLTRATLHLTASTPIQRGYLEVGGMKIPGQVEADGKTLVAELLLSESTTFKAALFTEGGHTDPEPRVNRITVLDDRPPTVRLDAPAPESSSAPGASVPIVVQAADDNGLGGVRLEVAVATPGKETAEPSSTLLTSWESFPNPAAAVLTHTLVIDKTKYAAGSTLRLRAQARDRRDVQLGPTHLAPQETSTAWHTIKLVAPEARSAADLARLDSIRADLARIFHDQVQARVVAGSLTRAGALPSVQSSAADLRNRQGLIQKSSVSLVAAIGDAADDDTVVIKRAVNKLAYGDMLTAVRQADALGQVAHLEELALPASNLTSTQDRILDVLRRLLNEVRKDTAETLAEMGKRPDSTLKPDVQDKLRALKDKLDEFLKQQNKVIEATKELAKKPVDDYTDQDEKTLKDLATAEDDWSRFMADRKTDLSKLPEQDFSNPSLLEEMVAVETELKMAKDALTKKTADIAVPLEQLGAEMAKEMTTNIEKWLTDTPDREKWSQEEPLTDEMKEAPMAELPKELEDIVGDLMEEEEDLLDEMEDASSSWADSLDKGAGWDAMDGPISNNSARGVTGNRLPNTSEIAGRSGEGRSGKSSGEFVGAEAVGKGGRKTPSRLTPDAFVKGQVKDTSKDPTGGATGGGKQSGLGGAGLQGPVPERPEQQMARLATKQAELRNKAEGVDLKFKVLRYHHADLTALIGQMKGVETDLRGGLYRNALRRREVLLQGLDRVHSAAKGEYLVRKDQTANLPTDIQKEILGNMQDPHPPGWEDLNRKYFERLGEGPKPATGK
ncbi:MAG: hypothetical protein U0794_06570 [Isosphaeraceae bacterium]